MPKLEQGLYVDCAEVDQPEGTYRFAKGIVDGNTPGSKENEAGFTNFGVITPTNYLIIGVIALDKGFAVFSTDNVHSEIGTWYNSVYTTIYNNNGLNFNTSAPIKGEYRVEATGNRVITWIDDNNPPRILNIDNPFLVNNVNDLTIFQEIINPSISSYSISDTGGSLPCGAYIPFTYYKGNDGSVTNFFVHDKTFYINEDSKGIAFNLDDGAPGLTPSNKAISITFAGCDTNFDNLVVGFIRTANQVTTAWTAITKTVGSTLDVTITGSEALTSVSLDKVLTANANYDNAKAITQVNNQLVLANLTSAAFPNFQPYATAIQINYTHSLLSVVSNTGTHKDVLPPSLMPGDVYAIYIGLELSIGGWVFYHIPGRPPLAGETDPIVTDTLPYKRYQVDNTSNSGGLTNMGYWENISETYPANAIYNGTVAGGPDLTNGMAGNVKVRHHRMPTLTYLDTNFGNTTTGITDLHVLGITATNVNIPAGIQSQIKRWKIFFAKKSPNNCIVGGSDLLHYPFGAENDTGTFWSTGGNWAIGTTHTNWKNFNAANIHKEALLGHSLDHLYAPNEFQPDFAWFHYGFTSSGIDTPYNGFRGTGSLLSATGDQRGGCAGVAIDFTVPTTTTKTAAGQFRKLQGAPKQVYVPQNAKTFNFKSAYTEPFLGMTITPLAPIGTLFNALPVLQTLGSFESGNANGQFGAGNVGPFPELGRGTGEDTVFMQYGKVVDNAHTSFTAQDLVPFEGYYSPTTTTGSFNGGDTFLCYMSYLACAPLNGAQSSTIGDPNHQGVRAWKAYLGYSRRNWNYRHQVSGDVSTYYHGKTDISTLFSPKLLSPVNLATSATIGSLISVADAINNFTYNPDFNSMNTLMVGVIYSVDLVNATEFPDLIIYSTVQGTESKDISWRIFPAGNRYTMPKNKGAIINVQGISNRDLLIHCQYTLYKTKTDIGVQASDGANVFLKSNELFSIQPEEQVSSSSSYAGTTNKFSCILTKMGYISVDDKQGKVFLFTDRLEEISTNGLRQFFRDHMGIGADNPFTLGGYTIAYDEKYNRILLTKKQPFTSYTISYNPIKKVWVSYHDYVPNFMFNTLDNSLYSFKDSVLYQHGTGAYGTFYDGVKYPMILDVVHNPEPKLDKTFTSTSWLSESYNSTSALQYFDTVSNVTLRSLDHSTPRTATVLFDDIDNLYTNNIRNIRRTWHYNEIRDIVTTPGFIKDFYNDFNLDTTKLDINMEWFDQRKFTDKFVICRLEYSNTLNNRFLIMETDIEYGK